MLATGACGARIADPNMRSIIPGATVHGRNECVRLLLALAACAESTWIPALRTSRPFFAWLALQTNVLRQEFIAKYEQLHAACNVRQCPTALLLGNVTMTTGRGFAAGLTFHITTCSAAAGFCLLHSNFILGSPDPTCAGQGKARAPRALSGAFVTQLFQRHEPVRRAHQSAASRPPPRPQGPLFCGAPLVLRVFAMAVASRRYHF